MATLIGTDGSETLVSPDDGRYFTLAELYRHLGCSMVQVIELADGVTNMWLDEEAKLAPRPKAINEKATALLADAGGIPGDVVLGPVLLEVDETE